MECRLVIGELNLTINIGTMRACVVEAWKASGAMHAVTDLHRIVDLKVTAGWEATAARINLNCVDKGAHQNSTAAPCVYYAGGTYRENFLQDSLAFNKSGAFTTLGSPHVIFKVAVLPHVEDLAYINHDTGALILMPDASINNHTPSLLQPKHVPQVHFYV